MDLAPQSDLSAPEGISAVSAETHDVVVIGSGFGGSIVANRLALAGKKVLVLERGPWRDTLPVRSMGITRRARLPNSMRGVGNLLRGLHLGKHSLTLNRKGLFEFFSFPGLYVLAASNVGGGSIAYGGLLDAPRNPDYWHGRHPRLDPQSVEKYYGKVMADMGAVRYNRDLWLPQSVWDHFPGSDRCRPADHQPQMAYLFPQSERDRGQEVGGAAGVKRRTSAFDGDSILGSSGGAKASADFVYLAPVIGKGVTVRDLCDVTQIRHGDGYEVRFNNLAEGGAETVLAKRVVLAAGTLNTLRLLFTSAGRGNGLAAMPSLGRRFGANGDLLGAWLRKNASGSSFNAPPCLGAFTVDGHEAPMLAMASLAGLDAFPLPQWLIRKLAGLYFIFGIGEDSGDASASFENGRLSVNYDQTREPIFDDIRGAFRILQEDSGDRTWALRKPLTPHQWGGACLGDSAMKGVVDHRGEVFGNPGLFIADGSALPAAPGGPPALTIAAWAHHVAEQMA